MKHYALALALLLSLVSFFPALPNQVRAITTIDSFNGPDLTFTQLYARYLDPLEPGTGAVGQTFYSPGNSMLLSASFRLKKVGEPTGSVHALLFTTISSAYSALPQGSAVATSSNTVDNINQLTTSVQEFTFTFGGQVVLNAGFYTIVVATDTVLGGYVNGVDYVAVSIGGGGAGEDQHPGQEMYWENPYPLTPAEWKTAAGNDVNFKVFGEPYVVSGGGGNLSSDTSILDVISGSSAGPIAGTSTLILVGAGILAYSLFGRKKR